MISLPSSQLASTSNKEAEGNAHLKDPNTDLARGLTVDFGAFGGI